jgi:hypothetical protein
VISIVGIEAVLIVLKRGGKARCKGWELSTRMFINENQLVCQRTSLSAPYSYALNLADLCGEWSVFE